jgi:hypothetical protein
MVHIFAIIANCGLAIYGNSPPFIANTSLYVCPLIANHSLMEGHLLQITYIIFLLTSPQYLPVFYPYIWGNASHKLL